MCPTMLQIYIYEMVQIYFHQKVQIYIYEMVQISPEGADLHLRDGADLLSPEGADLHLRDGADFTRRCRFTSTSFTILTNIYTDS